jgi:hypothetical protein
VAEKRTFFGKKWLKNMLFCAEVAEKRAFFGWEWLKNLRFLCGSG